MTCIKLNSFLSQPYSCKDLLQGIEILSFEKKITAL